MSKLLDLVRRPICRHVRNLSSTNLPVVVSINRFASDTDAEVAAIREEAIAAGARDVVRGHAKGGQALLSQTL